MLRAAIAFAILALLAGFFGYGPMESGFASIARIFLYVFLALFVVSLIFGRRALGGPTV